MKDCFKIVGAVFVLMVLPTFTHAQSLLFDQYYQVEYAKMRAQPQAYIDQQPPITSQPSLRQAQFFYLRADAYLILEMPNSAIIELQNGLTTTEIHDDATASNLRAHFFERISDAYLVLNNLPDARLAISDAINNTVIATNESVLLIRLQKRARIDQLAGASISALQDLQLALQLASNQRKPQAITDIALLIAQIHQQRNEHAIALSYADKAIDNARSVKANDDLLYALMISIPSLISNRQWSLAQSNLQEIKRMLINTNNVLYSARALLFAGEISFHQQQMAEAIEYTKNALKLFDTQYQSEIAQAHLLLSRAFTELDDMDAAIGHLVSAFNATKADTSNFDLVQNIHLHRAELFGRLDQFEEAYKVTKGVIAARDMNQPIDEVKRMLDIHTNFQLELQQQENIELKLKNEFQSSEIADKQMLNRLYFLVIALLLMMSCLLLFMFIRSRKHRKNLEQIAHTDALTELYSRRRIMEILEFQQDMYNRSLQAYCVAILDLDFFKKINDQYGHQRGDEVLKDASQLARDTFRKTDRLGRIGGEEFLFIFPDTPLHQGKRLLEKYRMALHEIGALRAIEQRTSASIGLVQPTEKEPVSSIISRADKALYAAKHNGRDQIVSEIDSTLDK
jgi:diguanylate cyclase (GGDEF)-like protein